MPRVPRVIEMGGEGEIDELQDGAELYRCLVKADAQRRIQLVPDLSFVENFRMMVAEIGLEILFVFRGREA